MSRPALFSGDIGLGPAGRSWPAWTSRAVPATMTAAWATATTPDRRGAPARPASTTTMAASTAQFHPAGNEVELVERSKDRTSTIRTTTAITIAWRVSGPLTSRTGPAPRPSRPSLSGTGTPSALRPDGPRFGGRAVTTTHNVWSRTMRESPGRGTCIP
ncbi:hypothetical protein [Nonomuraea aurantiaca]|uniref:hypothetical protein n=1 Tax=Nonomuraea aurantiaca TaxID=2878562 RepID=UPI001CD9E560|nr:hypothetical protein [Nonomuraea aurantiaca]MCA2223760.1 hypothetical protein [Nonomuraea aurantiaca]